MSTNPIRTICVTGAGTMGARTALAFAIAGNDVNLWAERATATKEKRIEGSLEGGMKAIDTALAAWLAHGLITAADVPVIRARIRPTTDLHEAASRADFVSENIAENIDIKKQHLAKLDKICPTHTIFASGTSGLSPTEMATATNRPDKVVVAHFFSPPDLVPLVEVVPGKQTSGETLGTTYQLMHDIGKRPALLKRDSPGFIGNVVQIYILRAACELVEQGMATAQQIDSAVKDNLNLLDMDIAYEIQHRLLPGYTPAIVDPKTANPITDKIVDEMLKGSCKLVQEGVADPSEVAGAIHASLAIRLLKTGPLESADMGGLDIFRDIFDNLTNKSNHATGVPKLITDALASGRKGTKTLGGIYDWTAESLAAITAKRAHGLFEHRRTMHMDNPAHPGQAPAQAQAGSKIAPVVA